MAGQRAIKDCIETVSRDEREARQEGGGLERRLPGDRNWGGEGRGEEEKLAWGCLFTTLEHFGADEISIPAYPPGKKGLFRK